MSKVVHLSDKAHRRAKEFCKLHGLKMSDWVATLIDEAVDKGRTDVKVRGMVPKKKILDRLEQVAVEAEAQEEVEVEEKAPAYARPPFWVGRSSNG